MLVKRRCLLQSLARPGLRDTCDEIEAIRHVSGEKLAVPTLFLTAQSLTSSAFMGSIDAIASFTSFLPVGQKSPC